jgi:hypothetical protein
MNVTRRGFLAGGLGLLAGAFGAKYLTQAKLPELLLPKLPHGTFLFTPGMTGVGNAYTTLSDLMAAVAAHSGPKTIIIDDSLAPAHVTAGEWNLDGCTFIAAPQ